MHMQRTFASIQRKCRNGYEPKNAYENRISLFLLFRLNEDCGTQLFLTKIHVYLEFRIDLGGNGHVRILLVHIFGAQRSRSFGSCRLLNNFERKMTEFQRFWAQILALTVAPSLHFASAEQKTSNNAERRADARTRRRCGCHSAVAKRLFVNTVYGHSFGRDDEIMAILHCPCPFHFVSIYFPPSSLFRPHSPLPFVSLSTRSTVFWVCSSDAFTRISIQNFRSLLGHSLSRKLASVARRGQKRSKLKVCPGMMWGGEEESPIFATN